MKMLAIESKQRMKWCQACGVLYDNRVPQKLKGKFYRMAIRPAMLYGTKCWSTKRWQVQKISVVKLCILRWICVHTKRDRVRNDDIRDSLGVAPTEEMLLLTSIEMVWTCVLQRRAAVSMHNGILMRDTDGKSGRGRSKLTWKETVKRDLIGWDIPKDLSLNRSVCKTIIHVPKP
jgi:hypothetical protein